MKRWMQSILKWGKLCKVFNICKHAEQCFKQSTTYIHIWSFCILNVIGFITLLINFNQPLWIHYNIEQLCSNIFTQHKNVWDFTNNWQFIFCLSAYITRPSPVPSSLIQLVEYTSVCIVICKALVKSSPIPQSFREKNLIGPSSFCCELSLSQWFLLPFNVSVQGTLMVLKLFSMSLNKFGFCFKPHAPEVKKRHYLPHAWWIMHRKIMLWHQLFVRVHHFEKLMMLTEKKKSCHK